MTENRVVEDLPVDAVLDPHRVGNVAQMVAEDAPSVEVSAVEFSQEAQSLATSLTEGRAVSLKIGDLPEQEYRFRPVKVTTDDFWVSDGADNEVSMDYAVFQGRVTSPNDKGQIQRLSAAVVGAQAVFAIT